MEYFLKISREIAQELDVTLGLFCATIILSIPLGFLCSLGATSRFKPIKFLLKIYTWLMRGTPLLLQIIFVYYALPYIAQNVNSAYGFSWNLSLDAFAASIVAFALNYAAYFSEIFRAGIESIDKGQYEASKALGMTRVQTMRYSIIPQMVRRVLPPIANKTINLVKDTSLVSIIALSDIFHATKVIVMRRASILPFAVTAVFYLIMVFLLTWLFNFLENRYNYMKREQ